MRTILSDLEIELYAASASACDRSWRYKNLNDPYGRIYLLREGRAWIWHHGRKFLLRPSHLYLIPPYSSMRTLCPSSMYQYWAHFNARVMPGLDLFHVLTPDYMAALKHPDLYLRLFKRLCGIYREPDALRALEADTIVRFFLGHFLVRKSEQDLKEMPAGMTRFRKVLTYIDEHLAESLTLDQLAAQASVHPTYFSNRFQKLLGLPPVRYINGKRMERAKILLRTTPDKLEAVARAVGFSDVFYFSRLFKKTAGLSPSAYRDRNRHVLG